VIDLFIEDPNKWFISIKISGKWLIISKEQILLYLTKNQKELAEDPSNKTKTFQEIYEAVITRVMKQVGDEILAENPKKLYIETTLDNNAAQINNQMDDERVFLGIVKNDNGDFVQYFTTTDIRRSLLKN
jgi:hypothetical protein